MSNEKYKAQKKWRLSLFDSYKCVRCGKELKSGNRYHCERHANYMVEHVRMSQRKIKELRKEFSKYTDPKIP